MTLFAHLRSHGKENNGITDDYKFYSYSCNKIQFLAIKWLIQFDTPINTFQTVITNIERFQNSWNFINFIRPSRQIPFRKNGPFDRYSNQGSSKWFIRTIIVFVQGSLDLTLSPGLRPEHLAFGKSPYILCRIFELLSRLTSFGAIPIVSW